MTIKERVLALIKAEKTTAHAIEKELGFGGGFLSRIGERRPSAEALQKLADRLNVSTEYLLTGEETPKNGVDNMKRILRERNIPVYALEKACGFANGYIAKLNRGKMPYDRMVKVSQFLQMPLEDIFFDADPDDRHSVPVLGYVRAGQPMTEYAEILDRVPAQYGNNEEYFALMIQGDSMEPRFFEGDIVIVHSQADAENGQIVVAQINGDEACVKKLIRFSHGIALQSLNPNYPLMRFSEAEIESKPVRILGRVVEIRARL